jgi:hypothetical protein
LCFIPIREARPPGVTRGKEGELRHYYAWPIYRSILYQERQGNSNVAREGHCFFVLRLYRCYNRITGAHDAPGLRKRELRIV